MSALQSRLFPETLGLVHHALQEGVAPGIAIGLWSARGSGSSWSYGEGLRRRVPSEQPLDLNTVFDLSSLTKVMATATLVALLVERRWIRWEDPVQKFLPVFAYPEITLKHLLSHTAGYVAWAPFWKEIEKKFAPVPLHRIYISERQKKMRDLVLGTVPEAAPGERVLYSDLSFLLLGFILEEILQSPLDHAVERYLWGPMGLKKTSFVRVSKDAQRGRNEAFAATEECSWRKAVIQGQVHDENCWAMGGYGGHAGAFAPLSDVLHFAQRLLTGFLTHETLQKMWTRVPEPTGCERTLGWDTPSLGSSCGQFFSPSTVGHLGFTGTSLWIDLEERLAVVLLTNRVHPTRENIKIKKFRPEIHDAIRKDWKRVWDQG